MSTIEKAIDALKQTAVASDHDRTQKIAAEKSGAEHSPLTEDLPDGILAADQGLSAKNWPLQNTQPALNTQQTSAILADNAAANVGREDWSEASSASLAEPEQDSAGDRKPVVNIPFDTLHGMGFLTPASPRSATAEEFRAIKRPLLKNIANQSPARIANANLIMVTSALEGDGKTFSSLNLAMSIAMERDKTVLYVDADVLKASAGKLLGIPHDTPGLIDLLTDETLDSRDVILPTNMKNFRILPAGSVHERATELLASKNMQDLMLELSARYPDRVIVFDSPPLLLTSESGVLASFMGQIVFVAAANVTPQHAVKEALEQIGEDKMVAVMLNMAPRRRFNLFGYGHGYGYGYGYGYGNRERLSPGAAEALGQ